MLKITATCIALFGVWKYFADRKAATETGQKARSLGYIQRFGAPDIVGARTELLTFWQGYPEFAAFVGEKPITGRAFRNFVTATYPTHDRRSEIDRALFGMVLLFDEVAYCQNSGICDAGIVDGFFCPYVARYAQVYGPFYQTLSTDIAAAPIDRQLQEFARTFAGSNQ